MSQKASDSPTPVHIGIIPDGNRRWARSRGLPTLIGHKTGFDLTESLAQAAIEAGVKYLTIWGFSTENWNRSEEEVNYLMGLYESYAKTKWRKLADKGARFCAWGDLGRLPKSLQEALTETQESTKDNTTLVFNVCLSYGGRDDIVRGVRKVLADGLEPEQLTIEKFNDYLDLAGQPPLDLIIRTSGEQRLSGFLPWQGVYSELYFTPVHFPDFTPDRFAEALEWYADRERRFGK